MGQRHLDICIVGAGMSGIRKLTPDYEPMCKRLILSVDFYPTLQKPHVRVVEAMKDTVWVTGCKSWYLDAEGVPNTWPWTARRFHKDMRHPELADFELEPAV